jgi:ribonuclease Z
MRHLVLIAIAGALLCDVAAASGPGPITVTLLGTAAGPPVNIERYQASTLVEAGDQRLLFDCGRGATLRLAQVGVAPASVTKVFLTHLHSDHIVDLPDLLLSPWAAPGRRVPLEVWGPAGTRRMMDHLLEAFAFDIHIRRDVDEKAPADGIRVLSHDVKQGVIFERGGVKVTAFDVDHGPVKPALGYRVDYGGHSVVMSGDTRFSENLIKMAAGVDVLLHEAIDPEQVRSRLHAAGQPDTTIDSVIAHHTTAEQAGVVFARVKPRLAVYSHFNPGDLIAPARKAYAGPLEVGDDMMRITIGDRIDVHRGR